jgi:hypothetical protein
MHTMTHEEARLILSPAALSRTAHRKINATTHSP